MNATIFVCSKCGETTRRWENTDDWLIANVPDSKTGEMVIRCPLHITEYAIRKAGGHIVEGKGQVEHREYTLSPVEITTRSKFYVRITNYWRNNGEADFTSDKPDKLTARQALAEYLSYHPAGSTHFTAFECIAPDGKRYNVDDLNMLVRFGMTK